MRQRFGNREHTILVRIQHRKQREDEIHSPVLMIHNLKPSLHKQVLKSTLTSEQVIRNALFLEDTAAGVTPLRCQGLGAAAQQQESTHTALLLGQCFLTCTCQIMHNKEVQNFNLMKHTF